jgi:hypothetical protein
LSLYADDVVIFLKPTMTDVSNLKELLHNFGRVTGLATNVRKSSVSPIRCARLDLENNPFTFPSFVNIIPDKILGFAIIPRTTEEGGLPTPFGQGQLKIG